MSFEVVSRDTVIIKNPRAGSNSMSLSLGWVQGRKQVSAREALTYANRILFLRHPIERVNSLFNMFWQYRLNGARLRNLLPVDTIRAWGGRVKGGVGANEHHWKGYKRANYESFLKYERATRRLTDDEMVRHFNNEDYRRFVDYILSGAQDTHWENQVVLSSYNGVFIPTEVFKLSELSTRWGDYVQSPVPIPHDNAFPSVEHDEYRLHALKRKYAPDLALWETL